MKIEFATYNPFQRTVLLEIRDRLHRWRIALVGGAVRDSIAGLEPRDLDLVVEGCPSVDCLSQAIDLGSTRTKLGGLRLAVGGVDVDVWRVEDNVIGGQHTTIEDVVTRGFDFDVDHGAIELSPDPRLIDGGMV